MQTECKQIQYSTVHKPAGIYDEMLQEQSEDFYKNNWIGQLKSDPKNLLYKELMPGDIDHLFGELDPEI